MTTVALIIISILLERVLLWRPVWRLRVWVSFTTIALIVLSHVLLLVKCYNLAVLAICFVGLYRIINLLRVPEARMHITRLHRVVSKTSYWLIGFQALVMVGWFIALEAPSMFTLHGLFVASATLQALVGLGLVVISRRNISRTNYWPPDKFYADKDLPTVTVAIPARNETPDLQACLELVVASDYPKLEILVLDVCSQDNTSDIIKDFAQAGVRFIHGHEPVENWLAKNQAYDQLADEATGEYIIFCGVDTRIQTGTIRALVLTALNRRKDMICVVPRRSRDGVLASLIQPMRYWWELALPRRLTNRPAVLSGFWLIKRRALVNLGGFDAVSHSVMPESYFARHLVVRDGYSFIRSSGDLGVVSAKGFNDQLDRAVRLRYPEVHRRMELVLLLSLAEFSLLLLPFGYLVAAMISGNWLVLILAIISSLSLLSTHELILRKTSVGQPLAALFTFPLIIVTELIVGITSMFKYEFSTVDWKGRNICMPVMRHKPDYEQPR